MGNHVYVTGTVAKDLLVKNLKDGKLVCAFSVRDSLGKDKSQFHNIKCFDKTAEFADKHLQKGDGLLVEGKLMNRSWTDQDGRKKYGTEIVANRITPFQWRQQEQTREEEPNFDGI